MGHLWDATCAALMTRSGSASTASDEVLRHLVLARIIKPTSKQDSLHVLEEAGAPAPSYPTLNRHLPAWAQEPWQQALSEACAAT